LLDGRGREPGQGGGKKGLSKPLEALKQRLRQALVDTAEYLPPIQVAFGWVHRVAHILSNHENIDGAGVRSGLSGMLGVMERFRSHAGAHSGAVGHSLKVTRSDQPGQFHCYDWPDLSCTTTNSNLEQFFGSHGYHERRATGRKGASPALVLRGSVRLVAAAATRTRTYTADELATADRSRLAEIRAQSEIRGNTAPDAVAFAALRKRFSRNWNGDFSSQLCQLEKPDPQPASRPRVRSPGRSCTNLGWHRDDG
jgi:hypothetical protein